MKSKSILGKRFVALLGGLLFTLASATVAVAQETTPTDSTHASDAMGSMHGGHDMDAMHKNMMGMHAMPATVGSVDKQTGVVDVDAGGMMLKVHFPPPAVANLQAGDKITLHMGYSKP